MNCAALALALSVLATFAWPLATGGIHFIRAAFDLRAWIAAAFLLSFVALLWLLRRVQLLALRAAGTVTKSRSALQAPVLLGCVVLGGIVAELLLHLAFYAALRQSAPFQVFLSARPLSAAYVLEYCRWSLRLGVPLIATAIVNFLDLHGLGLGRRRSNGKLAPFPPNATRDELILGEVHERNGSRSKTPRYLKLPALGSHTGILITGATGTGKSEGAIFPYTRQLVRMGGEDRSKRWAGLIIDVKGDMLPRIRKICAESGRLEDLYEIVPDDHPEGARLPIRMNVLRRPELGAQALAHYIRDAQETVEGRDSHNPFFPAASEMVSMQAIRAVRLAERRNPTLADLGRMTRGTDHFAFAIAAGQGRAGELSTDERADLADLKDWYESLFKAADDRTRSNVTWTSSTFLSRFMTPVMSRCFCAAEREETFPGFTRLIDDGRIVIVSMPEAIYKREGQVIAALVKMNFQDAVRQQLVRGRVSRKTFFIGDEYDKIATARDSDFWARCRAAQCTNIVAIQAYSSLRVAGLDAAGVEHFLGQLRTKIWLCAADDTVAASAASLCGKEERWIASRSVSENAQGTRFSFFDRRQIREGAASSSESVTYHLQDRFRFRPERFKELDNFQAIAFPFDGDRPLAPTVLYLLRDFDRWDESWFDWSARGRRLAS